MYFFFWVLGHCRAKPNRDAFPLLLCDVWTVLHARVCVLHTPGNTHALLKDDCNDADSDADSDAVNDADNDAATDWQDLVSCRSALGPSAGSW